MYCIVLLMLTAFDVVPVGPTNERIEHEAPALSKDVPGITHNWPDLSTSQGCQSQKV